MNINLNGDPELEGVLPINPDDDSIYEAVSDGVLLCKLINNAVAAYIGLT